MATLLQINASLFSGDGQSSRLTNQFVERWTRANNASEVIVRDLGRDPVPHLTADRFQAFLTSADELTTEQADVVAYSDALIEDWERADAVAIGLPMYNFGLPSALKAYFDHIARAGKTFRYTENGPVGLLADRPVHILAARGGKYQGTPMDTQTGYIRNFLGFLGIKDVHFVYAEGLAMGDELRASALQTAEARIEALTSPQPA